jgi:hypothetical protein
MQFNCGEPLFQRLDRARDEKYERLRNWHSHFALLPRRINNEQCVWFGYIERKGTRHTGTRRNIHTKQSYSHYWWTWEYRALETI